MPYRPEIDGLRALAVLPVLFFHAGFGFCPGGYVGVDMFFVISGYLITALLHTARTEGHHSLASFYERRARRLLPALYVVLLACLPAAWWLMNASDFINFSQSLTAVPVFSTGLLYMFTAIYFDTSSELKPLLHTWSLGVEEQFYLLYPLLLTLLWRGRRGLAAWGVLLLAGLSLWLATWATRGYPTANYYAMPTRAWELLLGAWVALLPIRLTAHSPRAWRQWASVACMITLAACCLFYGAHLRFPGPDALPPTLATAGLLAFATADTTVGRLLAHRRLVAIGLISYSAYLWHQPLFAFTRLALPTRPQPWLMATLIALTLGLAWLTWRHIETPARQRSLGTRRQVLVASVAASAAFMALGVAGQSSWLLTRWELQHPTLHNRPAMAEAPALRSCRDLLPPQTTYGDCLQSGSGHHTIVVWGDSHAKALRTTVPWLPPDTRLLIITHSGCPPLPGVRRVDATDGAHVCDHFEALPAYLDTIIKLRPDLVVIASRWNLYIRGWTYEGRPMRETFLVSDGNDVQAVNSQAYRQQMFTTHLQATLNKLAPHTRVLLLTQPVDLSQRAFRDVEAGDLSLSTQDVAAWHAPELALFRSLQLPPQVSVLDTKALFCDATRCVTRRDGRLLYKDDNHLSAAGTQLVWQAVFAHDPQLAAMLAPTAAGRAAAPAP